MTRLSLIPRNRKKLPKDANRCPPKLGREGTIRPAAAGAVGRDSARACLRSRGPLAASLDPSRDSTPKPEGSTVSDHRAIPGRSSPSMHEFGIATSTLSLVLEHARRASATRVARVRVRVGALSGVDAEALRFAFSAVTAGTLAEQAELEIEPVPAVAHCARCDEEFAADADFVCVCPRCGDLSGDIRQGRELVLAQIELACPSRG
jgi:hydrogenase nickel incorporation protein HypA/HybF